jgi:hypothetical protein
LEVESIGPYENILHKTFNFETDFLWLSDFGQGKTIQSDHKLLVASLIAASISARKIEATLDFKNTCF